MAEMAMDEDMEESAKEAGDDAESILVRTNYDPLALFAPEVRTDENGRASVPVTLPDNLTRYRVMVVAVAGGSFFGSGESNLTARLPLMVRPSAPRFLNFGDSFELPVVLQNQTDEPMETHIIVQATNAGVMAKGAGQSAAGEAVGYAVTVRPQSICRSSPRPRPRPSRSTARSMQAGRFFSRCARRPRSLPTTAAWRSRCPPPLCRR